ncbi:MAG TPA: universal stress protein [Chloroflexota bacterium]|nr:universal stress protein [Chloroflexota bacterium]
MNGIPRTDEEIEQAARTLLATEGAPSPANIAVHVAGGKVYLTGVVADAAERQRVLDLIAGVPGVAGIADELVTLPTPPAAAGSPTRPLFSKILVTLDGTDEAAEALTPAAALAGQVGAELCLLTVLEDRGAAERALVATYLNGVAAGMEARGVRASTAIRHDGAVAEEIAAAARELDADAIAMATHGRHGLARAWLGSVAEGVLASSPVPILLTRPGTRHVGRFRTLLVPLDATLGGALALAAATHLARTIGAGIVLLQVVPLPERGDPSLRPLEMLLDGLDWEAAAGAAARRYVDQLAVRLVHAGLAAQGRVAVGPVAPTIERVAGEVDADLIVMSTHALTGPIRAIVGSVADEVVRTAQRPVLLVRRAGRLGLERPSRLADPAVSSPASA